MRTTELLAILLPLLLVPSLLACLVFSRYKFRKSRRARSKPVDPAYEAKINRVALPTPRSAEDEEDEDGAAEEKGGWKDMFGGSWGVTPLAGVGPNGTRTFVGGLWGLDGGQPAGWSSSGDVESPPPPSYPSSPRESHFSRASRASRRSQLSYRGTGNGEDGLGAVDELGMLEKGSGRRREVETPEVESFVESGSGSMREEEGMMMREVRSESREEQRSSEKASILRGAA
ncbi:hypothetical protein BCR35DRAFT_326604 [Leucosporidium creatinivorum]|uniref:Uncharacterized protein n=1 Tax=Leucosporidium creatinivorum TaxID=106004 RepID=A0A1Y2DZT7_9BASI|nr:hypothetical protein BCR35DRAFT_326604 [Leucosporidium creatinivorum]